MLSILCIWNEPRRMFSRRKTGLFNFAPDMEVELSNDQEIIPYIEHIYEYIESLGNRIRFLILEASSVYCQVASVEEIEKEPLFVSLQPFPFRK